MIHHIVVPTSTPTDIIRFSSKIKIKIACTSISTDIIQFYNFLFPWNILISSEWRLTFEISREFQSKENFEKTISSHPEIKESVFNEYNYVKCTIAYPLFTLTLILKSLLSAHSEIKFCNLCRFIFISRRFL